MKETVTTLKDKLANRQAKPTVVEVVPEPGFVYKFIKPSKFALLFGAGQLPQFAASEAIEHWQEEGIIEPGGIAANQVEVAKKAFELRDKVIELSYEPKLVIGQAKNENELSTDDVPDEHLEYFFKWVAAGGDAAIMAAMFPERSQQNSVAGGNGSAFRTKAKRNGRHK